MKILVDVTNKELDALEDFCVAEMNPVREAECRRLSLKLWGKLCLAYDRKRGIKI